MVIGKRSAFTIAASVLAAGSLARGSMYSAAVLADNPLSYWQFAEASGVAGTAIPAGTTSINSGSLGTNGAYFNDTSKVGSGIPIATFPGMTGDNQSVNFVAQNSIRGSDAGLPTGNSGRTWTGWVDFTNNGSGGAYHDVFYYGSNSTNQAIFTLVPPSVTDGNNNGTNPKNNSGGVPGNFSVSQYGDGIGTSTSINDANWHFIAFTMTPAASGTAVFNLYVDGNTTPAATRTLGANTTLGSTYFIGDDSLNDPYFGQLAQEAVFGSTFTGDQLHSLYQAALAPEPASLALLSFGSLALLGRRRRASITGEHQFLLEFV